MTAVNLNRAVRGPVTAVPVVAGKGVRIVPDTVNNRFVVEADETVLWEGSKTTLVSSFTTSESIANFSRIRVSQIVYTDNEYITENHEYETECLLLSNDMNVGFTYVIDNGWKCWGAEKYTISNGTGFTMLRAGRNFIGPNTTAGGGYNDTIQPANGWVYKIVGINRIAGGN